MVEGAQSGQQGRAMQDVADPSRNTEAGGETGGGEPPRGPMLKVEEEEQPGCQQQQGRKGDALVVDRRVPGHKRRRRAEGKRQNEPHAKPLGGPGKPKSAQGDEDFEEHQSTQPASRQATRSESVAPNRRAAAWRKAGKGPH